MGSPSQSTVTLRDPVHGDIELTREEVRLVDTPQFQRLRGVKQLGTTYLVFPGALHTRFEHSIGTLHMIDRLADAVNKNARRSPDSCRGINEEERRLLRFAALLHDITHIPFGHNIEDQTGLLPRHDSPDRFEAVLGTGELSEVLDELKIRDEMLSILAGRGEEMPAFMRQALSDTIDAALLDYLRRDAYYTGLELRYDSRVADYFRIDRATGEIFVDCEKEGMLREDIVSELMRLLETRYHFSERVYYHHAKVAAGALLARMVERAMVRGALTADQLQESTDQSLLDYLGRVDLDDPQSNSRMRRFSNRFARRKLPKRVLVLPYYLNRGVQEDLLGQYFTPGSPDARVAWEAAVEEEARASLDRDIDVIMYCPARDMQLKEARTLVRMPECRERTRPLSEFTEEIPRLGDLQESYLRLWRLYIFTSETELDARRSLQSICAAHLPGCVNALRL